MIWIWGVRFRFTAHAWDIRILRDHGGSLAKSVVGVILRSSHVVKAGLS